MKSGLLTASCVAAALGVAASARDPATHQSGPVEHARQSDVIYGRKFGLALTLEVLAPARANGLGVVRVVSSNGNSSRDQTLTASARMGI